MRALARAACVICVLWLATFVTAGSPSAAIAATTLTINFKLHPPATRAEEAGVIETLRADPHVRPSRSDQEEGLAIMKKPEPRLVKRLPFNPFPDVIDVTVADA